MGQTAGPKAPSARERYTAERLEAACARSLAYELVDVCRLERIVVLAIEGDPAINEPLCAAQLLPSRFARPGSAFDHRYPNGDGFDAGGGARVKHALDPDLTRLLKRLMLGQLVPTSVLRLPSRQR